MRHQLLKFATSIAVVWVTVFCCNASAQMQSPGAGDCCTPDAQKKLAASVGFIDIVGIKLGMSPKEAADALRAESPTLPFKVFTTRLMMPSNPNNFIKVPHYIFAQSAPAPDHHQEQIVIEFTLPPNPPVVDRVYRRIQFADGQSVAAGNLISALQKKYGAENSVNAIWHYWIYETNAHPVTAPLPRNAATCRNVNGNQQGRAPLPTSGFSSTEYGDPPITLQTMSQEDNNDTMAACAGYVATVGEVVSPNPDDPRALSPSMSVAMQSAALVRNSRIATRDWMQADLDAKNKKTTDDGAARSAPKL